MVHQSIGPLVMLELKSGKCIFEMLGLYHMYTPSRQGYQTWATIVSCVAMAWLIHFDGKNPTHNLQGAHRESLARRFVKRNASQVFLKMKIIT